MGLRKILTDAEVEGRRQAREIVDFMVKFSDPEIGDKILKINKKHNKKGSSGHFP